MKRPAFQFYPGDWQRDAALRACSVAARGLWIEMMCVMHQAEPYGYLVLNERPIGHAQLSRMIGASEKETVRWMEELNSAGVYSADEQGRIFSRRMVRDEELRNVRAEGGKGGAEHGPKGAEHGIKGGRPSTARGDIKPPLVHEEIPPIEPPPSSSSSSSSSKESKTNPPGKRAVCIPEGFSVSDRVMAWAAEKGHQHLEKRLEHFRGWALAGGKRYTDWDQGFMNAIRDDWAKLSVATPDYSNLNVTDGV